MNIQLGRNLLAGVAFSLLLSHAAAGQSLTMTVNDTRDQPDQNPRDGICQTQNSTCTLRAAIQEANASAGPHTVLIGAVTYQLVGPALDIGSNVTVVGAGAGATFLQGGGNDRVVNVFKGATVTIKGVTIRGGNLTNSTTGGAGIRNAGNLTLRDCAVQSNGAGGNAGGGIYNEAPSPPWDPSPTLNLYNTTVALNTANHGAGIHNGGVLNITDSAISRNTATNYGGGVYAPTGGSTTITRSTIDGNTANRGGGLNMTAPSR